MVLFQTNQPLVWMSILACAGYANASSRTAANATGAYAHWMDIDRSEQKAQDGKGYLTPEDARQRRTFCDATGLPKPTLHRPEWRWYPGKTLTVTVHIERIQWQAYSQAQSCRSGTWPIGWTPAVRPTLPVRQRVMLGTLNYSTPRCAQSSAYYAKRRPACTLACSLSIEIAHQKWRVVPVQEYRHLCPSC